MRHGAAALFALCGLMVACVDITDPPLPSTAERFSPPVLYCRLWTMVESCSGLTGSLPAISWYAVPGVASLSAGGENDLAGYWSRASNRIVLVADDTLKGSVVRHEMLHALVRAGHHPRSQFLGRCAGVVDCGPACIADAEPPPTADPLAEHLPPDSLVVTAAIVDLPTGIHGDDGTVTIAVKVHNPRSHPVVAELPPIGDPGERRGYEYLVWGPLGGRQTGVNLFDVSSWTFDAGETKRWLFDFQLEQQGLAELTLSTSRHGGVEL